MKYPNAKGIVILSNPTALVESLPAQHGQPLEPRSLTLILLRDLPGGWKQVENVHSSRLETPDRYAVTELTSGFTGSHAIAVVVDRDADGPGDSVTLHVDTIARTDYQLSARGVHLTNAYAARAVSPGNPVWSLRTDAYIGLVPRHRLTETPTTYLCAPDLINYPSTLQTLTA
ncbi:hypothetical protein ACFXG4_48550 [Nocardia sp. NPDC059246]|uniref:hypothetical protein n=1 Tax=unclassified Nocardia TaxID=2637762 RepID=UPI0036B31A1A